MDRHSEIAQKANTRTQTAIQNKPASAPEPATDADFKSFVLYVDSADHRSALCVKALEVLTANPNMKLDTLIQDVNALPSRPSWLDSVPCIVVKSERRAFKDDACIKFITEYVHTSMKSSYSRHRTGTGHRTKPWI